MARAEVRPLDVEPPKAEPAGLKAAVGRAVRLRRVELGMDQRELAERLGTTQARVSKIERGTQDLRLSTLGRLEAALGIRLLASVEVPRRKEKTFGSEG